MCQLLTISNLSLFKIKIGFGDENGKELSRNWLEFYLLRFQESRTLTELKKSDIRARILTYG